MPIGPAARRARHADGRIGATSPSILGRNAAAAVGGALQVCCVCAMRPRGGAVSMGETTAVDDFNAAYAPCLTTWRDRCLDEAPGARLLVATCPGFEGDGDAQDLSKTGFVDDAGNRVVFATAREGTARQRLSDKIFTECLAEGGLEQHPGKIICGQHGRPWMPPRGARNFSST